MDSFANTGYTLGKNKLGKQILGYFTNGTLPLFMVLTKITNILLIITILNITVIVVSRSCTQRKESLRQKWRMFKINVTPA